MQLEQAAEPKDVSRASFVHAYLGCVRFHSASVLTVLHVYKAWKFPLLDHKDFAPKQAQ